MISDELITEAVTQLVKSAKPQKIILFGSYARGDAGEHSDLDFLVVQSTVKNRRKTMVNLQDALRSLYVPADILVVSQAQFDEWADVPGTVFYEAKNEGIVYYDSSQIRPKVTA